MIIRNWDDFFEQSKEDYKIRVRSRKIETKADYQTIKSESRIFSINYDRVEMQFIEEDIEKAVKILNLLGYSIEYKPIKVIDTLELWEELQKEMAESGIFYDRSFDNFFECDYDEDGEINQIIETNITREKIEEMFNVDLVFLKGCKK